MLAGAMVPHGGPGSSTDPPWVVLSLTRLGKGLGVLTGCFRREMWFVVLFWVLVQGARAHEGDEAGPLVLRVASDEDRCQDLTVPDHADTGDAALFETGTGCDGSALWEIAKACVLIGTWEIGCWAVGSCKSSRRGISVACQTHEMNIVPFPLSEVVPNRDQILFSLWLAGYKIDAEDYSEEVQDGFHSLIGGYLSRLEDGDAGCFD